MAGCKVYVGRYVVLCAIIFLFLRISSSEYNEKLETLIAKIDNTIKFYETNYKILNIDGIFGLRAIEGELMFLISQSEYAFDNNAKLPMGLLKKLRSIQDRARAAADSALPILQSAKSQYYKHVGFLVESAWRPTVYYRKLSPSLRWSSTSVKNRLVEEISDSCIKELHDSISQVDNNDGRITCKISNNCLQHMVLDKNTFGYGLLHQVLYMQIAQKLGCLTSLNSLLIRNGTNAYQVTGELCANAHEEMSHSLSATNNFNDLKNFNPDLFCEQVFTCSHIGYMEFANISFIDRIIGWQHPSGCFHDPSNQPKIKPGQRHLLKDVELKDGCSSHMTAVCLGALSVYLRLFLDFNIQMYFPDFPSYPRLIIEERNEIQRRNLPNLIDERDALEREKRRSKLEEKDGFKPVWPGNRPPERQAQTVQHVVEENNLDSPDLKDDKDMSSYVKTFFNWMFILSILMVIGVLFRKGYVLRFIAFLYRRQHSVFHNV